jgi:hypothetical protein
MRTSFDFLNPIFLFGISQILPKKWLNGVSFPLLKWYNTIIYIHIIIIYNIFKVYKKSFNLEYVFDLELVIYQ